ncbi:MAG: histidine phosphatase family protein [Anaerolineae bacterium]|nr:histidine phosphatase family protein [Anaerolineae bacterium]
MSAVLSLLLVRHGQTAYNASGRIQGWLDVPLDEVGHQQARRLAARLSAHGISAIYSSSLTRALDTARPIADACGLVVRPDDRLREYNMGDWTGLTREEIMARFGASPVAGGDAHIPNGESAQQVFERLQSFLGELLGAHAPGESVVLVSHGGTLNTLVGGLLGLAVQRRNPFVFSNGSVSELALEGTRWRLVRLNDVCHLMCDPMPASGMS